MLFLNILALSIFFKDKIKQYIGLSKNESSVKENILKPEGLIKELSDDKDNNFRIIKVNSKG